MSSRLLFRPERHPDFAIRRVLDRVADEVLEHLGLLGDPAKHLDVVGLAGPLGSAQE